jgi:hypothetical protein
MQAELVEEEVNRADEGERWKRKKPEAKSVDLGLSHR